jgi:GTP-binding protein
MSRKDKDGAWLFAQECRFVAGAASPEAMPAPALIEVAFAGRSNVGKSSLLNALTGRKHLARVSITPGRTQQLNFFNLGERLGLVDLRATSPEPRKAASRAGPI